MRTESAVPQQHVREFVSFEEALELILNAAVPVGTVEKRWDEALGDVLAEEIAASEPLPPFDQSAVDGYAVRAEETNGATPQRSVSLRVIDEVAAGAVSRQTLTPGAAIRIMTGAAVPAGADAVVPVEQTVETDASSVKVLTSVQPGDCVRRAGEDLQPGTSVLQPGVRLTPARIGLLALLGRTTVKLYRKPSVAILATGNELVDVGAAPAAGKIRNANSSMLGAMARELGCRLRDLGLAGDEVDSISAKLRRGLGEDVVITSGGVSVGRHDHVIEAMQSCGVELLFRKVRIKPGMPLVVGRCRRTLFFGLPGNPVSALVTFLQFVRPALLKMMGAQHDLDRVTVPAMLEHAIVKADRKRHFHRAIVERRNGGYTVRSSGGQGSHMMASLARANGLIPIPEESSGFEAGQRVQVELL